MRGNIEALHYLGEADIRPLSETLPVALGFRRFIAAARLIAYSYCEKPPSETHHLTITHYTPRFNTLRDSDTRLPAMRICCFASPSLGMQRLRYRLSVMQICCLASPKGANIRPLDVLKHPIFWLLENSPPLVTCSHCTSILKVHSVERTLSRNSPSMAANHFLLSEIITTFAAIEHEHQKRTL